jgi:tetratricopeptide (TPR) repeat protein
MYMHCTNCGNPIEDASKFCSNCGTPVANNSIPEMSQPTYSLGVTGEIVDGQSLDAVKDNLEKSFKLDRKILDLIFAKKNFVIKKDIAKEMAEKYKKAFTKCGAICKVTENVTSTITSNKSTDSSSQLPQSKSSLSEAENSLNNPGSAIDKVKHFKTRLWNPKAAADWCTSVTPILGAYFHSKSWSKPLGISTACLFALIVVFSVTASYWDSAAAGTTDCDLLAAYPRDSSKVAAGVEWDDLEVKKAVRACKKALKEYPRSARLMYQYGRALHKGELYENALNWYRNAADEGHVYAMYLLGTMYESGEIVEKDVAQAIKWYRKAADEDNVYAILNLGRMYEGGIVVAKDDALALSWYRKAAENGDADAEQYVAQLEAKAAEISKKKASNGISKYVVLGNTPICFNQGAFKAYWAHMFNANMDGMIRLIKSTQCAIIPEGSTFPITNDFQVVEVIVLANAPASEVVKIRYPTGKIIWVMKMSTTI